MIAGPLFCHWEAPLGAAWLPISWCIHPLLLMQAQSAEDVDNSAHLHDNCTSTKSCTCISFPIKPESDLSYIIIVILVVIQ